MRKARVLAGGITALTLVALTACGSGASNSSGSSGSGGGTIKIGEINPFSGPQASGGTAIDQGYQLAVGEANKAGGVLGKQIELVKGDATTPSQGTSEVTRLASSEKVDLFAGCYISAVSNTASQTAVRYGKLYWDTNAVAQDLTQRGLTNYIRSGPSATEFAQGSVQTVQDLLPAAIGKPVNSMRIYISHENSSYGSSIADIQQKNLTGIGAQVTNNIAYDAKAADLGGVIVQGQQSSPDVWIDTGYVSDISLLLRTAQQQHFRPKVIVLVGSGDNAESLKAIGDQQLQGVLVVAYPHTDMAPSFAPGADKFLSSFTAKFGGPPAFPQSLSAYVGMKQLLDAIKSANSTAPDAVRKAVSGINKPVSTFANGFGEKFDNNLQNVNSLLTTVQWQSGKTVTVFPKAAALPDAKLAPLG